MHKLFYTFTIVQILFGFILTSGLSAQAPAFREGYVITIYNDTIRGLISNAAEDEVVLKDSQGYEKTFIPADLKGFERCNMEFITYAIPGDSTKIFLAHLLKGTIDLFGTVVTENQTDAVAAGLMFGGLAGGLIGAAASGTLDTPGAGTFNNDCKGDRYSIGAFYLRKASTGKPLRVPNGRKKFNDFMIPLMRDHMEVVREIPEAMFYSGNLISIVKQYNAVAGKPTR
jgi:hypothetical protein